MQLVKPGITMLDTMKNKRSGPTRCARSSACRPTRWSTCRRWPATSSTTCRACRASASRPPPKLINEYGDLDTLLARAGEIKQPKRRERLIEHAEQARLSRELVRLKDDVPVEASVDQLGVRDPEPDPLLGFLREMEFTTLHQAHRRRLGDGGAAAGGAARLRFPAADSLANGEGSGPGPRARAPAAAVAPACRRRRAAKIDRSKYETVTDLAHLAGLDRRRPRRRPRRLRHRDQQPRSPCRPSWSASAWRSAPGEACYVPLAHGGSGHASIRRRQSHAGATARRRSPR